MVEKLKIKPPEQKPAAEGPLRRSSSEASEPRQRRKETPEEIEKWEGEGGAVEMENDFDKSE